MRGCGESPGSASRGRSASGPRQSASRRSSSSATASGSTSPATTIDAWPGTRYRAWNALRSSTVDAGDGLLGPAQREAVGMIGSVEGPEQGPVRARLGAVPLGPEGGERLAVDPLPLRLGEGRVDQDVGRQVQGLAEVGPQAAEPHVDPVPAATAPRSRPPWPRRPSRSARPCGSGSPRRACRRSAGPGRSARAAGGRRPRGSRSIRRRWAGRGAGRPRAASPRPEMQDLAAWGTGKPVGLRRAAARPCDPARRAGPTPSRPMTDRSMRGLPARYRVRTARIACRRHLPEPPQVGRDQARVAAKDVVGIEPIGDAAEAADVLQREAGSRRPACSAPAAAPRRSPRPIARASSSASTRSLARSIDRDGRSVTMMPNEPGQLAARLVGADVLRDLLLDHQPAIEPAGPPPRQDVAQQDQRGVIGVEVRHGRPGQVDAVQLDAIAEHDRSILLQPTGPAPTGRSAGVPPGIAPK